MQSSLERVEEGRSVPASSRLLRHAPAGERGSSSGLHLREVQQDEDEANMKTMITIIAGDGRRHAAASFEVDLRWLALKPEEVDRMPRFRCRYLCNIMMSDPLGHFQYFAENRGLKGRPKSRGSRLATRRRRTIAKRR